MDLVLFPTRTKFGAWVSRLPREALAGLRHDAVAAALYLLFLSTELVPLRGRARRRRPR